MESLGKDDLAELARLVEVTSDAVALCAQDGTILHVNRQMASLALDDREHIVGPTSRISLLAMLLNVRSDTRCRFTLDTRDCSLMLPQAARWLLCSRERPCTGDWTRSFALERPSRRSHPRGHQEHGGADSPRSPDAAPSLGASGGEISAFRARFRSSCPLWAPKTFQRF